MILPGGKYRVFLATRPVDFRKGHAGLSLVVQTVLGLDPYCGAVFVFRSKRGDRVKILVWDQTGLVMVYKHLEGGSFHWPTPVSIPRDLAGHSTNTWPPIPWDLATPG